MLLIRLSILFLLTCFQGGLKAQEPKLVLPIGHNDKLNSASFSPDGKRIITSSFDGTAKVWDAKSGSLLFDLKGSCWDVINASFSADGNRIVTACDTTGKIWDARKGTFLFDLEGNKSWINSICFSPDSKNILISSNDGCARIFDAGNGKLKSVFTGHKDIVNSASFSTDGKMIVTASNDSTAKIWDTRKRSVLAELMKKTNAVTGANFSPDGTKVLIVSNDGTVKIWSFKTGVQLFDSKVNTEGIKTACFSPDGKKMITTIAGKPVKIWDAENGRLIHELTGHQQDVYNAVFSPDGNKVITASGDSTAKVWDVKSGKQLIELKGHTGHGIYSVSFSTDGHTIVTKAWDQVPKIWDAQTGMLLGNMTGYIETASSFSPDGKKYVTIYDDNSLRVSDAETGNLLYSFLALDSNDYFIQIPSKYYSCTRGAARLLHYLNTDYKVISFEQLDIKYNRPDKVLEAIGNPDTALISAYKKAYYKRLKKLDIDTSFFSGAYSVPEADFINREDIGYEQTNENIQLQVHCLDSTYFLDRFNVFVNDVPVYGMRGISIKQRYTNQFDTTITIRLSQGENRIETSVININGTESYRIPLYIKFNPAVPQKEMAYFIGIGIKDFADTSYNLHYCVKDIRDLADSLNGKTKGSFVVIDTLFDKNVTVSHIKALKQKLLQTTVNDKVIIAYSGHGLLSRNYDYYLSTYPVNFKQPEQDGLAYDDLENLLDSIPARKKLMLIDACYSGELDKEELLRIEAAKQQLGDTIKGKKGGEVIVDTSERRLGMKNTFELMQQLFVNVGKSTGATIISAAAGTEFAREYGNLKNGVFTYSILEAMRNHSMLKVSDLKRIVGQRVEELTQGLQKPASRNETINIDWEIW